MGPDGVKVGAVGASEVLFVAAAMLVLLSVFIMMAAVTVHADNGQDPIPTYDWHDFYGDVFGSGEGGAGGAEPGDIVTAKDPDGVVCGKYVIGTAGRYGFMHVYTDDSYTQDVDEGAVYGDIISFYYNGSRMKENATWLGSRARTNINLTIRLVGDVDWDCAVGIIDLAAVGLAFGSGPGDGSWNLDADLTDDGTVNIFDLATVGLHYTDVC